MSPRRYGSALLASLFALQLLLPVAAAACTMGEPMLPAAGVAAMADVTGKMGMGMVDAGGEDSEQDPRGSEPCDQPAPDHCRTMAACSSGVVAPSALVATQAAPGHSLVTAAVVLQPLSESRQPEPPPPRA